VNGPLAAFTTVLLILSESSTIITQLSKNFLIADALVDTFDGVLVARNETGIVSEGRQLKSGSDPINKVVCEASLTEALLIHDSLEKCLNPRSRNLLPRQSSGTVFLSRPRRLD
jgi:hypothetical protein